jgi:hypothetical protein
MSKIWITVSYPVSIEIEFDAGKIMDDEYIAQKREEAKTLSESVMETTGIKPVISDAELPGLIE